MGHYVTDREATINGTIQLVTALRGHTSGVMLWCLSDIGDKPFGPLDAELKPNAFGRQWRRLAEPGGLIATWPVERVPAQTTIQLERLEGLAPDRITQMQKLLETGEAAPAAVDFVWPLNPMIGRIREGHEGKP
jgi:hypothetical protein